MLRDLNYAIRMFKKNPGFSVLTMTVMSVGLGLAIYMFAIVNLLAYKKLDITDYDRLLVIDTILDGFEQNGGSVPTHDYFYMKQRQQSFSEFSAYDNITANLSDGTRAQRFTGAAMEPGAFALFDGNKNIAQGRAFTEAESIEGAEPVMLISHRLWQDYFAGKQDVVGSKVKLNGEMTTIIGVMNEDYHYPMNQEVFVPFALDKNEKPGKGWHVTIAAQLKPGVDAETAMAELSTYSKEIAQLYPETNSNMGINGRTPVKLMMDNSMPIIYIMVCATLFILILVITNVGNLMLARASERNKEFAIRTALGAPKYRIIRQMMLETLIICFVGGGIGILLAGWGLDMTKPTFMKMGGWVAPWWTFTLGKDELIAAVLIVLGTAFLTGVIPAIKSSDSNVNEVLRDGTRGALGKKDGRLSKILVTSEIFLSCAVLIVAGALIIGVNSAINADYGVDTKNMLTARFSLFQDPYTKMEDKYQFHKRLLAEVATQPGVQAVTIGSALPGRNSGREPIAVEGLDLGKNLPRVLFQTVDESYMSVLGAKLLEGRHFDGRDVRDGQKVTIVTDTFVKRYWPEESALGKRIKFNPNDEDSQWYTIIGVVKHMVHQQPFADAYTRPAMYVSNSQFTYSNMQIAIRVDGNPYDYQQMIMEAAGKVDANIPMYEIIPYEEKLYRRVMGVEFVGKLFIVFGVLALILAAAGIFGVMSQNVTRRTQEFGVRRALGATESKIYKLLLKQSTLLLVIGGVSGAIFGYLGTTVLSGNLMNLIGYYPYVAAIVVGVIAASTALATILPANKALQLEPNNALRYE